MRKGIFSWRVTCFGTVVALFLVLAFAVCNEATAGNGGYFWDGNKLHAFCNSSETFEKAWCDGYVVAVADVLSFGSVNGLEVCVPSGVVAQQLIDIVKNWLRDHPDKRQYVGMFVVTYALREAYPCR